MLQSFNYLKKGRKTTWRFSTMSYYITVYQRKNVHIFKNSPLFNAYKPFHVETVFRVHYRDDKTEFEYTDIKNTYTRIHHLARWLVQL